MKAAKGLGRDTQGVRLMRLTGGDKVASVSAVSSVEEEMPAETESPNPHTPESKKIDKLEVNYYDNRDKTKD
jgi:hypothetical protein